jgi:hypothetical protein
MYIALPRPSNKKWRPTPSIHRRAIFDGVTSIEEVVREPIVEE